MNANTTWRMSQPSQVNENVDMFALNQPQLDEIEVLRTNCVCVYWSFLCKLKIYSQGALKQSSMYLKYLLNCLFVSGLTTELSWGGSAFKLFSEIKLIKLKWGRIDRSDPPPPPSFSIRSINNLHKFTTSIFNVPAKGPLSYRSQTVWVWCLLLWNSLQMQTVPKGFHYCLSV